MDEKENIEIPDFSDPAFENDKEVKKWREEDKAYEQMINDSIRIVSDSLRASRSSHKNLKGFELHKSIDTPFIMESHTGSLGRKTVFFSVIRYHTSMAAARMKSSGADDYFAGVIMLDRPYPHTVILPETAALKIHNLFVRGDVDFKHAKWFSFKFHVITKDENRLKRLFENIELNKLNKFKNAEIELKDNQCYFRANRKPVTPKEAEIFANLATAICEIF